MEEKEPVVYGLVKNVESFNLWTIAWDEYGAMFREVGARKGLGAKLLRRVPSDPTP